MSLNAKTSARTEVAPRPPATVMTLARLGSLHQTRLSFLRAMLRRLATEGWTCTRPRFDFDAKGVGTAVYTVSKGQRAYSLVAFGHDLPPEKRTDRVIAEAWDATFSLYDGIPGDDEIARLKSQVPGQETARLLACDLVLARANRSVRLFDKVVDALAEGRQPDRAEIEAVGYLMRTTAVYGSGKFGMADREDYAGRPELAPSFRAEMLAVWLIRTFTVDLVEHMARLRSPRTAVVLEPGLRRRLGIGNSTGLGLAPFLVKHPTLLHSWVAARETALSRVRALPEASLEARRIFTSALARARAALPLWTTDDKLQAPRIALLGEDLGWIAERVSEGALSGSKPFDALYRWGETGLSLEGQEFLVTLLLEPHGALVDDLADTMQADEAADFSINGTVPVATLAALIDRFYPWALALDHARPEASARFWYVSEEKLEPRLGERASEPGADLEMPLAIARDIARLRTALAAAPPDQPIAELLLRAPEHRHVVRRVQLVETHPYGEIQGNLVGAALHPIDMLRAKLAFFGCTRFDPRSDKWLRITMFQGAPFADRLADADDGWVFGPSEAALT